MLPMEWAMVAARKQIHHNRLAADRQKRHMGQTPDNAAADDVTASGPSGTASQPNPLGQGEPNNTDANDPDPTSTVPAIEADAAATTSSSTADGATAPQQPPPCTGSDSDDAALEALLKLSGEDGKTTQLAEVAGSSGADNGGAQLDTAAAIVPETSADTTIAIRPKPKVAGARSSKTLAIAPPGKHAQLVDKSASSNKATSSQKDAPSEKDGQLDDRTTSRAQRHVMKLNLHTLPAEERDHYVYLIDPNTKLVGKQKRINEIINKWVPRDVGYGGALAPAEVVMTRYSGLSATKDKGTHDVGMGKWTMIGAMLAGNEELWQKARDANEIWSESDGLWYSNTKTRSKNATRHERLDNQKKWAFGPDSKADLAITFNKMQLELVEENEDWLVAIEDAASPTQPGQSQAPRLQETPAIANGLASDDDYVILQESFDSVTRVTAAIRKIAMQVQGMPSTPVLKELVGKAIALCKEVIPSQQVIEELLFSDRDAVTKRQAVDAMKASAGPYRNILNFHNELVTLANYHLSAAAQDDEGISIKVSKKAAKFKPIKFAATRSVIKSEQSDE